MLTPPVANNKIFALPPDEFEFDVEETADSLLKAVKLICDQTEKKYKLPKNTDRCRRTQSHPFCQLRRIHRRRRRSRRRRKLNINDHIYDDD